MMIVPGSGFITKGGGDPYWANVVLLLHFDGTGAAFVDSSSRGHTITASGNATQTTTGAKFAASGSFDGSGDYIYAPASTDFRFRRPSESWCVEFCIKPAALPASQRYIVGDSDSVWWTMHPTGIRFDYFSYSHVIPLTPGVWSHLAFVCEHAPIPGNTTSHFNLYMFKDGALEWSGDHSATVATTASVIEIGRAPSIGGGSNGFDGLLDEFRVTKGVARYTADFTPPTAPFPNS